MSSKRPIRPSITASRALQISNHVSEEYLDDGQTSFATKAELCETILWLNQRNAQELQRKDAALDEIFTTAAAARIYTRQT